MTVKKILIAQYDLHNLLFNNVIADINDAESNQSILEPMNNVKWLAGHLLWAQRNLARMGGADVIIPWMEHFLQKNASTPEEINAPKGEFPTLQQIKDKWNEINLPIRAGLESLPEETLNQIISSNHPLFPFDDTLAGLLAFINHHQAYTIGQIGILRRGMGKEAMKYD
ncbi:DinB family protein [Mucilaginibacter sp. X4EP1]|uniref:DinB family protein n=1 Tax=Mucilaginibacter sp. X4EP1 TaxID=2723092 RepID=UPI00216751E3|nr:DinB family protein [Mucilaginibacter sp. X4EP1]MCS3815419.1 putative damage-inducible protein DinB [Mucilaginibacter sp. X4EP1]